MIGFADLPDMDRVGDIIHKLRTFRDRPVRKLITFSEIRELEKAVGLIDAIAFEEMES